MSTKTTKNSTKKPVKHVESELVRKARERLKMALEQEKRNNEFAKLNPAEQRVAIAQDALVQLKLRRLIAESGTYVSPVDEDMDYVRAETPVCEVVSGECNVCAKGALFVAAIDMKNGVTIKDVMKRSVTDGRAEMSSLDSNHIVRYLNGIFTRQQLDQIEAAFEGYGLQEKYRKAELKQLGYSPDVKTDKNFMYMPDVDDDGERLKAIMQNIVDNDGEFVLNKKDVGYGSKWS